MNILLGFGYSREAVPTYLEAEFRREHRVITCGPSAGRPQDLPCAPDADMRDVLARLPADFSPDVFLWVSSPNFFLPRGVDALPCPTACYQTASFWDRFWTLHFAKQFDHVLVVPSAVPLYRRAGLPRVHGILNACDPGMAAPPGRERPIDVAFLGTAASTLYPERARYLARLVELARRHDLTLSISNYKYGPDLVEVYQQAKLVFNAFFMGDGPNMRVFEAMACGCAVLTDDAATAGSGTSSTGMDRVFRDGEHVACYDDARFEDQVMALLRDPDARIALATRGQQEVLAKHTYPRRSRELLAIVGADPETPAARPARGEAELWYDLAVSHFHCFMPNQAAQCLERLEAALPSHPDLPHARAVVAAARGKPGTEDLFRAAIALDRTPLTRASYAWWLVTQGRGEEARKIAKVLPLAPWELDGAGWSPFYFPLGIDYFRVEWHRIGVDGPEAAGRARFLKRLALSILCGTRQDFAPEAIRAYKALGQIQPVDPAAWYRAGALGAAAGSHDEAVARDTLVDTALVIQTAAGEAPEVEAAILDILERLGLDPGEIPDVMVVETEESDLLALFRAATALLSGGHWSRAVADSLGLPILDDTRVPVRVY